ncbi:venom protease-like [Sitodiplosis mosellana]|uniref:venom protease-like n=1 Tax=Sitodiplosis mosellana TaxID=263140 RepID=UPI00244493D6|nr:venom protease-like [Sitodiplosis mosellana]
MRSLCSILCLVIFIVQISNAQGQNNPHLLTEWEGCGIPPPQVRQKRAAGLRQFVVGGINSPQGGYPWMALLGYVNNLGEQSWKCGGSLITSRHVLTAAHCVIRTLTLARFGEHDINSDQDGPVQDININRKNRHPNFNKRLGTNDIAILHLEHDVIFSNRVRPICIPTDEPMLSRSFVGETVSVAGWGRLQEGGRSSNVLQKLQLPVLNNFECKERFRTQGRLLSEDQFDNSIICAGDLNGGHDSCQGDSGGPMMYPVQVGGRSLFYQIGIISYGIGCARVDTPGVYTRVSEFIDWIQDEIYQ